MSNYSKKDIAKTAISFLFVECFMFYLQTKLKMLTNPIWKGSCLHLLFVQLLLPVYLPMFYIGVLCRSFLYTT